MGLDGDEEASTLYWENEIKCRKFSTAFFHFGCCHVLSLTTALIPAFYGILTGNIVTSAWGLPFNIVLPVSKESVSGWFLYWFYSIHIDMIYTLCMILPTSHFVCFCYYIIAICNHFGLIISSVRNDSQQIRKEKNTNKHPKMWRDVKKKVCRAVDLHINSYE